MRKNIKVFVKFKKINNALKLLGFLDNTIYKIHIQLELIQEIAKYNPSFKLDELFAQALKEIDRLFKSPETDVLSKIGIFDKLAEAFTEAKKYNEAKHYWKEANKLAFSIKDEISRELTLEDLPTEEDLDSLESHGIHWIHREIEWEKLVDTYVLEQAFSKALKIASVNSHIPNFPYISKSYLSVLTQWSQQLEKIEKGLFIKIFKEVTRISGWVNPKWQEISNILDIKAPN